MHPIGPSHFFKWRQREDICRFPLQDILGILSQACRNRGAGGSLAPPPQSFLSVCPFFRRSFEMSFLKEATKNVHEN